ncbi:MAG: uL15m family ribosomal protein [Halobellus sp.]|uniref:uL15m family ribosomal protein n=1 Tax=Halobellus sp. TaxID=1979212 RepID=UPI0035D51D92
MTSKKRRQRGSRTHGGGTHKNRRGAGHRGGRGRAGRDKHEFHNYEPIGKHGFKRPDDSQRTVAEVNVSEIDEDVALLAADGVAETEGDAYHVDARDVADDVEDAGIVKVLGGGQVRQELHLVADAFSESAINLIEDAGGSVELTERGEELLAEAEAEAEEDENDEE